MLRSRSRVALLLALALPFTARVATAQVPAFVRAMEMEQMGRAREAAAAYRAALPQNPAPAMLGLERVMAELGWRDTLLMVVDSAISARPRESTFRVVQLRTLRASQRGDDANRAFEKWLADAAPRDPQPFREYARVLLQSGQVVAADTVLRRAQNELGDSREFLIEIAQIRSSMGLWGSAAEAWRDALQTSPFFEQAAAFALQRADTTDRLAIRSVLAAPPIALHARRLLATLELAWGSPSNAWAALKVLPRDTSSLSAWRDFAERAERSEAWLPARDALEAMLEIRFYAPTAVRAASVALEGGQPASALALAMRASATLDSAQTARMALPVIVGSLAALGRPQDADRMVIAYSRWIDSVGRSRMLRNVAWGWVRAGNLARAHATLDSAGGEDAADEVSAWLALYEGRMKEARDGFRVLRLRSPESIRVMSLLSRTKVDSAPAVGRAFLMLATGDTAAAADAMLASAAEIGDAAPLLMAMSARLALGKGDEPRAVRIWTRIIEEYAAAPEAPEAALEWGRQLRRRGEYRAAVARLEQMILAYPNSALVPQARRELELARAGIRTSD